MCTCVCVYVCVRESKNNNNNSVNDNNNDNKAINLRGDDRKTWEDVFGGRRHWRSWREEREGGSDIVI